MRYNFLFISFLVLLVSCNCVSATWWDDNYDYRKKIILTGNVSGAQTDYQLLLNVTYDSDMQSDFDDLRFCNDTHELDSWLKLKVDNSYALVWVEFPTTPANGVDQTYYMYYGNAGAANAWDIDATFVFGDDFHRSNSETVGNGWIDTGDCAIESEKLKIINTAAITRSFTFNSPYMFEWKGVVDTGSNGEIISRIYGNEINQVFGITIRPPAAANGFRRLASGLTWSAIGIAAFSTDYSLRIFWDESASKGSAWYHDGSWNLAFSELAGYNIATTNSISFEGNDVQVSYVYYVFVRKYAANQPTYAFGSEETILYTPPNPIMLINTTGNFWVNHTWSVGSGNVTDSYNVSVNNIWYNTTIDTFYNDTYTAHVWQNITVYAFNTSSMGTLSTGNISQNTLIPNNPITITNTSDWSGDAGEIVYVDYDATDIDSDTATFSCDRIDLFTDFDTSTGTGNWTATANIYYVDFGVSDGYGSSSNYTMTLIESSVEITLTDEIKLITSEITTGLKSINMGDYLVYAFILIGILLIILLIQILNNCIYRG